MRHVRSIAVSLSLAVLVGALGGCGKKETKDNGAEQQRKGRWVETREELPEELVPWNLRQMFSAGGEVHLLASRQENGKTVFSEWAGQGEVFTDVTQGWLASVELPCEEVVGVTLTQSGDGTQYLAANYALPEETSYRSCLWKSDAGQAKDITPEKWTVPNEEWGMYESLRGIAALEDGSLFALTYTSMDLLSGEDGNVLESEEVSAQYNDTVVSDGENIYLCATENPGMQIEKRQGSPGGSVTKIDFPTDSAYGANICATEEGSLIVAGTDGIFRRRAEADTWEKLLDGLETDFAMTESWCAGLAVQEDGSIYALFQESGGGARLNRYAYDPEAVVEIEEELHLYTVYESPLLQQAAVMYHREHPEVAITIQYAYSAYDSGEADYNAVYQELNTLLMGEDAPDILVLDGLDMDSFMKKGLLADIGEAVGPMEERGELLSGITGNYIQEDGKRYIVPLQFGFNMALGRDIEAENMASMEALADFLSGTEENYLGPQTIGELVDKFYPYFCGDIVKEKQLDREVLGGRLECLKKIADSCGIVESRGKGERAYSMWDLASGAKLAFSEVTGFKNCMFPIAIVDYIQGSFAAYENSFLPLLQTGICAKSRYQDTAMDFLRLALSESVQDKDHYLGFPVNLASLEKQAHEDRSESEAFTSIEAEGGEVEFAIRQYSDETAEALLAICKTLDKPAAEDAKIREVLIEALGAYLEGSQTNEATVQRIEDGLKMYLAE
ncbi:extracellular solute-binding protein [uncultured Acetatifactor sp.]|uniref:extracellular solute-binding protein n=1 Tax=uncultured Acetatifactor sp. TaxID=1671927 RepID=UPI00262FAE6B|nr:extracellular solute-binding protein [uncultured Acetatifactor sp.]